MGMSKQLLPIDDQPAVVRCIDNIRHSNIDDIVVVVNPDGGDIVKVLAAFSLTVAVNESVGSDMAESIRTGLNFVDGSSSGIFVCLSDHPLVTPATIAAMGTEHCEKPDRIIIPVYQGRKGHPTLFPRSILEDIRKYSTLRDVVGRHREKVFLLAVDDEGVVMDMDTPEDYRKILDKHRSQASSGMTVFITTYNGWGQTNKG